MSAELLGQLAWEGSRESSGHRTFQISWLLRTNDYDDGPSTVMNCTDLAQIGDVWAFGNDLDIWAFCWPDMKVKLFQHRMGERHRYWQADQTFKTLPNPFKRCNDQQIENPLEEPDRISGTFNKYSLEAQKDRNGNPIRNSSHEQIRGASVEFDANRPTVRIEQNVDSLELDVFSQMIDNLNDAPLWGLSARCVKLSNVSWERKYYGTCSVYYTRGLEFDIRYDGFDRDVLDEGTKVIKGRWDTTGTATNRWIVSSDVDNDAGRANPQNFIRAKDIHGENIRVLLDGNGSPLYDLDNPVYQHIEYYPETNMLVLGLPTELV